MKRSSFLFPFLSSKTMEKSGIGPSIPPCGFFPFLFRIGGEGSVVAGVSFTLFLFHGNLSLLFSFLSVQVAEDDRGLRKGWALIPPPPLTRTFFSLLPIDPRRYMGGGDSDRPFRPPLFFLRSSFSSSFSPSVEGRT